MSKITFLVRSQRQRLCCSLDHSSSQRWPDLCSWLHPSHTLEMSTGKRLILAGRVSPVVEVHALHGEGVGASLLVLQDPRLHHHHHLCDEESDLDD